MYRYFRSAEEPNIFWRFIDGDTPAEGFDTQHHVDGWTPCRSIFLDACIKDGDIEVEEAIVLAATQAPATRTPSTKYSEALEPVSRLNAEEQIAAIIFDYPYDDPEWRPHETACAEMSRQILQTILRRFRPDLIEGTKFTQKIQVVCQQGGSSGEYYGSGHNNSEEAQEHIDDCWNDGAYHCIGPYEVESHKIGGVDYIKETDVYDLLGNACGDAATEDFADVNETEEENEEEDEV